jgi:hypothetical protein
MIMMKMKRKRDNVMIMSLDESIQHHPSCGIIVIEEYINEIFNEGNLVFGNGESLPHGPLITIRVAVVRYDVY